jgi:FkbM family methyltransferase
MGGGYRTVMKILNRIARWVKHISKILRPRSGSSNYYSQNGEDAVLVSFYEGKPNYRGFYVDIGAHHPVRFSNTQLFYERGWRGINIDATPGSMKAFNESRKNDINIEVGASDISGNAEYFSFEESALNSFDRALSEERIDHGWKLKEKIRVPVMPINDILEKYLPSNITHIDFITIDVEGLEFQILRSFDFHKYAPDYFLVEDLSNSDKDIADQAQGAIYRLLTNHGYVAIAKTQRTFIFKK